MQCAGNQRTADAQGMKLAEILYVAHAAGCVDLSARCDLYPCQKRLVRSGITADLRQSHSDHLVRP